MRMREEVKKRCPIIRNGKANELVKQRTRVMNPVQKWVTDCWEYVKLACHHHYKGITQTVLLASLAL